MRARANGAGRWTIPASPSTWTCCQRCPTPRRCPNAILLTDRELRAWQHSNPVDYADWFHGRMRGEFITLREVSSPSAWTSSRRPGLAGEDDAAAHRAGAQAPPRPVLRRRPEGQAGLDHHHHAGRRGPTAGRGTPVRGACRRHRKDAGLRRGARRQSSGSPTQCSRRRTSPTGGASIPAGRSGSSSGWSRPRTTSPAIGARARPRPRRREARRELRRRSSQPAGERFGPACGTRGSAGCSGSAPARACSAPATGPSRAAAHVPRRCAAADQLVASPSRRSPCAPDSPTARGELSPTRFDLDGNDHADARSAAPTRVSITYRMRQYPRCEVLDARAGDAAGRVHPPPLQQTGPCACTSRTSGRRTC